MNFDTGVIRTTSDPDAVRRSVTQAFFLRPIFRRAFLLCDVQGFTVKEAADILGIGPAAVEARLDRARRLLSVRMREALP